MRYILSLLSICASLAYGQVADFEVQDGNGGAVSFSSQRAPVTVVTFISTQCPISNAYNDRMTGIYKEYSAKGVRLLFVNANRNESAKEVAEHAKSVGFPFPVYLDSKGQAADKFDAQVTPQSFVIDATGAVVYRGQIDDNRNEARVDRKSLRLALDATLAGRAVAVKETKAFGCTIKRARRVT